MKSYLFLSRTARPKSSLPISSSTNLNVITEQPASKAKLIPNFNDAVSAHGNKSIVELIRSILVFQLCKFPFLVNNANQLLNYSNRILGSRITNLVVRETFFKQFCAGETQQDALPIVQKLRNENIGIILDYAVEDDSENEVGPTLTFSPGSEEQFDHHTDVFLQCIHVIKELSSQTNGIDEMFSQNHSVSSHAFAAMKGEKKLFVGLPCSMHRILLLFLFVCLILIYHVCSYCFGESFCIGKDLTYS